MKRCAWCNSVLEGPAALGQDGAEEAVSHGICPDCFRTVSRPIPQAPADKQPGALSDLKGDPAPPAP